MSIDFSTSCVLYEVRATGGGVRPKRPALGGQKASATRVAPRAEPTDTLHYEEPPNERFCSVARELHI